MQSCSVRRLTSSTLRTQSGALAGSACGWLLAELNPVAVALLNRAAKFGEVSRISTLT